MKNRNTLICWLYWNNFAWRRIFAWVGQRRSNSSFTWRLASLPNTRGRACIPKYDNKNYPRGTSSWLSLSAKSYIAAGSLSKLLIIWGRITIVTAYNPWREKLIEISLWQKWFWWFRSSKSIIIWKNFILEGRKLFRA